MTDQQELVGTIGFMLLIVVALARSVKATIDRNAKEKREQKFWRERERQEKGN